MRRPAAPPARGGGERGGHWKAASQRRGDPGEGEAGAGGRGAERGEGARAGYGGRRGGAAARKGGGGGRGAGAHPGDAAALRALLPGCPGGRGRRRLELHRLRDGGGGYAGPAERHHRLPPGPTRVRGRPVPGKDRAAVRAESGHLLRGAAGAGTGSSLAPGVAGSGGGLPSAPPSHCHGWLLTLVSFSECQNCVALVMEGTTPNVLIVPDGGLSPV